MHLLKKIIREELEKVLSTLSESDLYNSVGYKTSDSAKDNIIYNYEKGRQFAGNNLEVDITNLNRYHLVEYLPKSVNEEKWSFEFDTVFGTILIIDIKRTIANGKSFWSMQFGQLYKGEKYPNIIEEVENIEGYEKFVTTINNTLSNKIDPSKY